MNEEKELSALEQIAINEDLVLAQVFAYETFSSGWLRSQLHAWFPTYYLKKWERKYNRYRMWVKVFRDINFPNE